jgi:hypothetical protein
MALHVVQHLGEVGQRVVQIAHVGHTRGLDLEALGAALQHAFIGGCAGRIRWSPLRAAWPIAFHIIGLEHLRIWPRAGCEEDGLTGTVGMVTMCLLRQMTNHSIQALASRRRK